MRWSSLSSVAPELKHWTSRCHHPVFQRSAIVLPEDDNETDSSGVKGELRSCMRVEGEACGMEGKASDVKIVCPL
jgi:hypothetical protein